MVWWYCGGRTQIIVEREQNFLFFNSKAKIGTKFGGPSKSDVTGNIRIQSGWLAYRARGCGWLLLWNPLAFILNMLKIPFFLFQSELDF